MLSDTRGAALVAADGTIDWYCAGSFAASASLFRLLDPAGGAVRAGPAGAAPSPGWQQPDEGSLVWRTRLWAGEGLVEVADVMPWEGGSATPPGRIVRVVSALRGPVDVEVAVQPGDGFRAVDGVDPFADGVAFGHHVVRTGTPFDGQRCLRRLDAGERWAITVDERASRSHHPLSADAAAGVLERTARAWREHGAALAYDGPFAAFAAGALRVLRALTFTPTGALVAAPTASLPEDEGGERNVDGRVAWVRHSASALALTTWAGLAEDAALHRQWLRERLREGTLPLRPVWGIDGGDPHGESELGLAGWRRSQPVRVGVGEEGEGPDLGLLGVLLGTLSADDVDAVWPQVRRLADWTADHVGRPDRGRWAVRCRPRPLVASHVEAWAGLTASARVAVARHPLDLDAAAWKLAAAEVEEWLETHGRTAAGGLRADVSRAAAGDGPSCADAALLPALAIGPWPADDELVVATVDRVVRELSEGVFVHRFSPGFDDGFPPARSCSVAASFWAVAALARVGRWEEAHERMEVLVRLAGAGAMLPAAVDPVTRRFTGNVPSSAALLAGLAAVRALSSGPR